LQICNYAQKHFVAKVANTRLPKTFVAIFAFAEMHPTSSSLVAGRMSTKPQVSLILLLTVVVNVSLSEPAACKPQNRECSCADTSLQDCGYFSPTQGFQVDQIEQCMDICQALNPIGQCEWLLYSPAMEDKSFIPTYPNCQLFGPNLASMEQYVNTCDRHGQPIRRHDGSCTANATNPSTGECNASRCPSGCAPCDETDECHRYFWNF